MNVPHPYPIYSAFYVFLLVVDECLIRWTCVASSKKVLQIPGLDSCSKRFMTCPMWFAHHAKIIPNGLRIHITISSFTMRPPVAVEPHRLLHVVLTALMTLKSETLMLQSIWCRISNACFHQEDELYHWHVNVVRWLKHLSVCVVQESLDNL